MFVRNFKEDFYNLLIGHRILVLVNHDVDAICACKILQALFKCDNVAYTLVPIKGVSSLKSSYDEHCEEIKYVVLINCGGTVDLVELLEPDADVVFFILDSHRPTDVCNIYNTNQVNVLLTQEDDESLPEFNDIFREDDESGQEDAEESENEGDGDGDAENEAAETRMERIQRKAEERIRKRQERRLWDDNRTKLLFDYYQYSYFARSSAITIFEIAWKLSKDNNDLLWWAIVGATEQILMEKIENSQYVLETGTIQSHITRLAYNHQDHQQAPTSMIISLDKDVRLALYRHWSIESSLRYSSYSASRLRLWTLNGEKKLHQLLADMGLPLAQARQAYSSMDLDLKNEFLSSLEKLAEKYSIPDIVFISFNLKYGYRNKFCATDVVFALLAILEQGIDSSNDYNQNFQNALDALSRCHGEILKKGIETAKRLLMSTGRQIQSCMEAHQIVNAGPFLYLLLPTSSVEKWVFGEPHWLGVLARWALCSHRGRHMLPLLVAAPRMSGTCILLGIPPLADDSTKNLFGKAFEQAAIKSNSNVSFDFFDTSVMMINSQDVNKFLDALTTLMT